MLDFYSIEQHEILNHENQGMAIIAGAGCGKTTTLVAKCVRYMEHHPQARLIAVSFTEKSARDLKLKMTEEFLKKDFPLHPHWLSTLHGLCWKILKEFSQEAGLMGDETILSQSRLKMLWNRVLDSLWSGGLPQSVETGLDLLLETESRKTLYALISRVHALSGFGVLRFLEQSEDLKSKALGSVSHYIEAQFQNEKRNQSVLDFIDLEIKTKDLLENSTIKNDFHRRFDLILVDEFQDTNPTQARIIELIARQDYSNLCVVGDPKQSIYRFRDADVSLFEEFCSKLVCKKTLSWNFRSRPALISFVNTVCAPLFQDAEVPFQPLVAAVEETEGGPAVERLMLTDPQGLAQWLKDRVKEGLLLKNYVLLLRKIRGNEKWIQALYAAGIPILMGSGGLFWQNPCVRELVAFLKWWHCSANTLSGGIFLRAPWMQVGSDELLDQWHQEDPTWWTSFFASEHRVAQGLRDLIGQVIRPGVLLMRLFSLLEKMDSNESDQELELALFGLWHRVEEWSLAGFSFTQIISELTLAVREENREQEIPLQLLDSQNQSNALLILTLHGAKGLEFQNVILVDFPESPQRADFPNLYWDRHLGVFLGARDSYGKRISDSSEEKVWRDLERQKALAESKRLFYVGLTRAKKKILLACIKKTDKAQRTRILTQVWDQDDWRGWIESVEIPEWKNCEIVQQQSQEDLPWMALTSQSRLSFKPRWKRSRHSVTEWVLLSRCPRAYEWTYIHKRELDLSEENPLQHLGEQVHFCLASYDWVELEKYRDAGHFTDSWIQWVKTAAWMQPTSHAWVELAFEVPVQGQVLLGTMDRLIRESDGLYSLLDFKITEKLKPKSLLIMLYQTQLALYVEALSRIQPECNFDSVKVFLVNAASDGMQIVPVTFKKKINNSFMKQLVFQADRIMNGETGQPEVGFYCRFCKFLTMCSEGKKFLESNS